MDTGSHISTISINDVQNICDKIRPTSVKAKGYSGSEIKFLGEVSAKLTYNDLTIQHVFLIVDSKCVPLLGRDVCSKLNINFSVPSDSRISNVKCQNSVLKEFDSYLCSEFQSNVTETVSFKVDENALPIFSKSRSVPLRLKDKVKNELKRLEETGRMTKVF